MKKFMYLLILITSVVNPTREISQLVSGWDVAPVAIEFALKHIDSFLLLLSLQ